MEPLLDEKEENNDPQNSNNKPDEDDEPEKEKAEDEKDNDDTNDQELQNQMKLENAIRLELEAQTEEFEKSAICNSLKDYKRYWPFRKLIPCTNDESYILTREFLTDLASSEEYMDLLAFVEHSSAAPISFWCTSNQLIYL